MSRTAKQKILEGDAKMAKKFNFLSPSCLNCQYRLVMGTLSSETRYCTGFKKKKARRFRSSDPQIKPPKWCPRRLPKPICRIYGFADEMSELIDMYERSEGILKDSDYVSPPPHRYKLRLELPLGMKAQTFYEAVRAGDIDTIFSGDTELELGEVVEIDDGMKPYYFYYMSWSKLVPIFDFSLAGFKKGD